MTIPAAPASNGAPPPLPSSSAAANDGSQKRRRTFTLWCLPRYGRRQTWRRTFQLRCIELGDCLLLGCTVFVEKIVYVLGPLLICFALAIMTGLGYTFFHIILPMLHRYYELRYPHVSRQLDADNAIDAASQPPPPAFPNLMAVDATVGDWIIVGHICLVCYFLSAIAFNYFMCVTTRNVGKHYQRVVRELADAQGVAYPETPEERQEFQDDTNYKLRIRWQRRQEQSGVNLQRQRRQQLQHARTSAILQRNTQLAKHINTTLQSKLPISASAVAAANQETALPPDIETGTASALTSATVSSVPTASTTMSSPTQTIQSSLGSSSHVQQRRSTVSPGQSRRQQSKQQQQQPNPQQIRSWMYLAPDEWSWCTRSNQPKPPRSHYDHVSKALILNLDHYCPWMFNAIGYFNYRYFCSFLWLVQMGMLYGACLTYTPFVNSSGPLYRSQVDHFRQTGKWERMHVDAMIPYPREKMPISLAFMICLAVGIAVACLGGFHFYLVLTAQTTIEFHGNFVNARKARKERRKWTNPYSLGVRRNWQQVFGSGVHRKTALGRTAVNNPLLAVLVPSGRQPEFLPLPIAGDLGRRPMYRKHVKAIEHSGDGSEENTV